MKLILVQDTDEEMHLYSEIKSHVLKGRRWCQNLSCLEILDNMELALQGDILRDSICFLIEDHHGICCKRHFYEKSSVSL